MRWPTLLGASLLALSCQKTTGPEPMPASETASAPPASEPSPPASTPTSVELPAETPDAAMMAAAPADAAIPPEPACTPVAKPPTLDVQLRFSTGRVTFDGSMPAMSTLVAKVSVSSLKLSHEVWSSPAPTSCNALAEGDEMVIHCITDEGQLDGRVRVVGEELVVEAVRGVPMVPEPTGANRPAPVKPQPTRELSVKVPCGSRLRVHAASRDFR